MFASHVMSLTVKHEAVDIAPQVFNVESEKVLFKKQHLKLVRNNISLECREHNFPVLAIDAQRDTSYRDVVVQKCWSTIGSMV